MAAASACGMGAFPISLAALCTVPGHWADGGLLLGLLLAGAAGSPMHCVPMCGGFVLGQVADRMAALPAPRLCEWRRVGAGALLPYHAGRLTTYAGLGGGAGFGGAMLTRLPGFSLLAGALLLVAAGLLLLRAFSRFAPAPSRSGPARSRLAPAPRRSGLAPSRSGLVPSRSGLVPSRSGLAPGRSGPAPRQVPAWGQTVPRWSRAIVRLAGGRPAGGRGGGFLLGVALGFLPCGLVYAALAASAASGSAAMGALGMLAFGLGTAPALMAVGIAGQAAGRRWQRGMAAGAPVIMLLNAGLLGLLAVHRLAAIL